MPTINLEDSRTWPMVGTTWRHRNGNQYEVLDYTNIESDKQDKYPTTIVYRNIHNGKKYSRPLMDWLRSMLPVL